MMAEFVIGTYKFCHELDFDSHSLRKDKPRPDLDRIVKSYDHELHQSLDKIFQKYRPNSARIKEFSRDQNSAIKSILEQEPILSKHFLKGKFEKLSLLWTAILADYKNSAELLVRSGADVNERFGFHSIDQVIDKKWTILHVLIQMDPIPENDRLIRLITEHGADLQARDSYDRTALNFAVMLGRVQMAEVFLENGADSSVTDRGGESPLTISINKDKATELLPILLKYRIDVSTKTGSGKNALHLMAWSSDDVKPFARALLEMGASLEYRENRQGFQPLHEAAWIGKPQLLELYLDYGADVNARANDGQFPLQIASRCGSHPEVVKILIERGANVDLRDSNGCTALHSACQHSTWSYENPKQERIMKLLLDAGADVLIEDYDGNTAFSIINRVNIVESAEQKKRKFKLMIKALALKKARQPSLRFKDEIIIENCSEKWNYYLDCCTHIYRMKYTRLIRNFAFFDFFTKSHHQIAALMRNRNFEENFELYDLRGFSMYAEEVLRAFKRAQKLYRDMLKMEEKINEAVYQTLPYLIVEKVVSYIFSDGCKKECE